MGIADLANTALARLDEVKSLQAEVSKQKATDAAEAERQQDTNWRLEAQVHRLRAEVGQSAARLDNVLVAASDNGIQHPPRRSDLLAEDIHFQSEDDVLEAEITHLRRQALQAGRDVEAMASEVARLQDR